MCCISNWRVVLWGSALVSVLSVIALAAPYTGASVDFTSKLGIEPVKIGLFSNVGAELLEFAAVVDGLVATNITAETPTFIVATRIFVVEAVIAAVAATALLMTGMSNASLKMLQAGYGCTAAVSVTSATAFFTYKLNVDNYITFRDDVGSEFTTLAAGPIFLAANGALSFLLLVPIYTALITPVLEADVLRRDMETHPNVVRPTKERRVSWKRFQAMAAGLYSPKAPSLPFPESMHAPRRPSGLPPSQSSQYSVYSARSSMSEAGSDTEDDSQGAKPPVTAR